MSTMPTFLTCLCFTMEKDLFLQAIDVCVFICGGGQILAKKHNEKEYLIAKAIWSLTSRTVAVKNSNNNKNSLLRLIIQRFD